MSAPSFYCSVHLNDPLDCTIRTVQKHDDSYCFNFGGPVNIHCNAAQLAQIRDAISAKLVEVK